MSQKSKMAGILFLSGLLAFTLGLYSAEIIKIDCRYGLFVHEMNLNNIGPFPMLLGKPYTDYPSIHIILMALFSRLWDVNMLTITLPSAIAAAGVLAVTYIIGERRSHRFGILAVLLLCLSYQFIDIARAPSSDMIVALIGALAFLLVYTADLDNKRGRLWLLPLLALLGFAIRGPIGTVIPAAIVVVYYLVQRKYKKLIFSGLMFGFMLIIGVGVIAGWAFLEGGRPLVERMIEDQVLGRMSSSKPFWFYFADGVAVYSLTLPFAMFVIATYLMRLRKGYFKLEEVGGSAQLRQALTAWIFIIMLGLSVPGSKHLRYIVSVLPPAALLAAFIFDNPDRINLFNKLRIICISLFRYLPYVVAAALLIAFGVFKIIHIPFQIPFILPIICFICLGLAVTLGEKKIAAEKNTIFILLMMAVSLTVLKITVIDPIEQQVESSRKLVAETEKIRPPGIPVCFYGLGRDGYELKYLINIDREKFFMPVYVSEKHPEELLKLPYKNMPIIANDRRLKSINAKIMPHLKTIAKGKLGHRKCRLFIADIYAPDSSPVVKTEKAVQ